MKEQVTFTSFFSTIGRGIAQAFQWLLKITGLKGSTKYTRFLRIIVGTCITIWLICGTWALIYEIFEDQIETFITRNITGDTYYDDTRLSANVYLQESWVDDYMRIYNYETGQTTLKMVDWVVTSADKDSLAVYSKNGKRGYLNRFTGEIAIPAQYDKAWVFSEGVAAVVKDGELYFIDHNGETILTGDWKYYHGKDFVFKQGHCVVWNGYESGFGLIDTNGNWILEAMYDNIIPSNGIWIIVDHGRFGLLDAEFNTLLPTMFEDIYIQDNLVYAQPYNASTKLYDMDGSLVNDCLIDEVYTMYYEAGRTSDDGVYYTTPLEQLASCYKYSVHIGNYEYLYGLLNVNGQPITDPIYTNIEAIAFDLFLCEPQGIIINSYGQRIN